MNEYEQLKQMQKMHEHFQNLIEECENYIKE